MAGSGVRYPAAGLAALVDDDPQVRLPALHEVGAGLRLAAARAVGRRRAAGASPPSTAPADSSGPTRPTEVFEPVSNTLAYRAFSTVLQ